MIDTFPFSIVLGFWPYVTAPPPKETPGSTAFGGVHLLHFTGAYAVVDGSWGHRVFKARALVVKIIQWIPPLFPRPVVKKKPA